MGEKKASRSNQTSGGPESLVEESRIYMNTSEGSRTHERTHKVNFLVPGGITKPEPTIRGHTGSGYRLPTHL